MSRVSKEIINLKELQKYSLNDNYFVVEGKLGINKVLIPSFLKLIINEENKTMNVTLNNGEEKQHLPMNGTIVRLIKNAITGVTKGFSKIFLFKGLGYKYILNGNGKELTMQLGYSHPVYSRIPENIIAINEKPERLKLTSISKESLGLYGHKLKTYRKWNPYSGKGIMEEGEIPQSKEVVKSKK